jgi:hypothetical protein
MKRKIERQMVFIETYSDDIIQKGNSYFGKLLFFFLIVKGKITFKPCSLNE